MHLLGRCRSLWASLSMFCDDSTNVAGGPCNSGQGPSTRAFPSVPAMTTLLLLPAGMAMQAEDEGTEEALEPLPVVLDACIISSLLDQYRCISRACMG